MPDGVGIVSYTITYVNSISGTTCGAVIIPASICDDWTCSHLFEITSSSCTPSAKINVTAYFTTSLGDGQSSAPLMIGCSMNYYTAYNHRAKSIMCMYIESENVFVDVVIDLSLTTVFCKFLNQQSSSIKSCTIEYGPSGRCDRLPYSSQNNHTSYSTTVTIDLPTFPLFFTEMMYCFTVTANNGTHTVKVDGNFYTGSLLIA